MIEVLKKKVSLHFEEAVEKIERLSAEAGFTVMLTKALHEIFKQKLKIEYPKYTFIQVCNAQLAKRVFDISKDARVLFPCSFVVYEEDGNVVIAHTSVMRAITELRLVPKDEMAPIIEETGRRVRELWEKI